MFEEKHNIEEIDILMRSILSQAEEEVPEHVWDGISKKLDRKPVVLWFRRSAIAVAAAAAVAVGLFMNWGDNGDFMPEPAGGDMIAVVGQEATRPQEPEAAEVADEDTVETAVEEVVENSAVETFAGRAANVYVADAAKEVEKARMVLEAEAATEEPVVQEEKSPAPVRQEEYFPEEWPEDDVETVSEGNGVKTSIVISGLAGTNNSQSKSVGALRQPSIGQARPKTGIKETSTQSIYGLPLSAGLGVKLDLSQKWSLGVGMNYSLLTRKFYGTYTRVNENGVAEKSVSSDIRNSQQYIGIPFNAFYNVLDSEYMNFYAYVGGTVEKCISDKYDLLNTDIVHIEKAKGVQLSANVGVGVEFLLGQHLGLYIDPSLRYYFRNGQPKSIRTAQPLMLGFEMGLRVRL